MSEERTFKPPNITDEDIVLACRLLKLPEDAFYDCHRADPRQEVLKSMMTMDIPACPGSGKTTLLVAKLAILAEKWQYDTRGICVLSHTNAARHEIETKLGNTSAGRRLLSYPHYIGTIHGFVNEFLALPFLRSGGHDAIQFSTESSGAKLWRLGGRDTKVRGFLARNFSNANDREPALRSAHYFSNDLDLRLRIGSSSKILKRSSNSDTFKKIDAWKHLVLCDGYAAYEDTFAYGSRALKKHPYLIGTLRDRFPVLFIDEAQDNSEDQSSILYRIFMEGTGAVIRERFGDSNQAIFESVHTEEATTDSFPIVAIQKALPNSHRFGQQIANLADPLGLAPYGLKGEGPKKELLASGVEEGEHTVFLFEEESLSRVLDQYGELLLNNFSEEGPREGVFAAVGQVHQYNGDDHKPRHVGHYWSDYDSELSRPDPKPPKFVQYVAAGMATASTTGEAVHAVEKIAEGILRLAGMAQERNPIRPRRRRHRQLLELLRDSDSLLERYREVLETFVSRRAAPTKETWTDHRRRLVLRIAETIARSSLSGPEVDAFLEWSDNEDTPSSATVPQTMRDNIYRFPKNGKEVVIRVGSIHSVKGQTHTATLVLETFFHEHNLEALLPWLLGNAAGVTDSSARAQSRLKLHYVAMTRPTHLLCLAMKASTFRLSNGDPNSELIQRFEERGWRVRFV